MSAATSFRCVSQTNPWTGPERATEAEAIADGRANRHRLWPSFMFTLQALRDGEWRFAGSYTTREVTITYVGLDGQKEVASEASFKSQLPAKMLHMSYRKDAHYSYPVLQTHLYELEALTGADCHGVNRARYRAVEEIKPARALCPCCHQLKEESWSDMAARLGVPNPLSSAL